MTKKTRIRIGMVVIIVCVMCFSDWSFAEDESKFGTIAWLVTFACNVLSRIWVLFAKIAGEFLSNKWIYGEVVGLDAILWQYRNVVKNIANFALGFYFSYVIFNLLIKKDDMTKGVKDILLWILVAGVGIQSSWFFVAAMIDVSTVTFVAAGTLPYQIISQSSLESADGKLFESYKGAMNRFKYENGVKGKYNGLEIKLFGSNNKASNFIEVIPQEIDRSIEDDTRNKFDSILPTAESMEGPLYYMGLVLLQSNNGSSVEIGDDGAKKTIINMILKFGATVVYSIEMIVLCIFALMRILYLWMFIVLSPLAVLIWSINKSKQKLDGKLSFLKSFTENINFSSFFINVFKPTIIALGISISVVMITLISGVLLENGKYRSGKPIDIGEKIKITSSKEQSTNANMEQTYSTSIESDLLVFNMRHVGSGILEIFLSILAVVLVYMVIKAAVEFGDSKDFVSKKIGKIQEGINDIMTQTPIIPVGGYDEKGNMRAISVGSAMKLGNTAGEKGKSIYKNVSSKQAEDLLKSWNLLDNNSLTPTHKTDIRNIRTTGVSKGLVILEQQRDYIRRIELAEGNIVLNPNNNSDPFWREEFVAWLNATEEKDIPGDKSVWKDMLKGWKGSGGNLEKLFSDPRFATAYANFFGYSGNYNNFDAIKNLDISKTKKSNK